MTLPRCFRAGDTILVTRRTLMRMFLLRPSSVVEHVFSYCLAQAAAKFGVQVHGFTVMSNHFHIVLTDVRDELPRFMHWLDGVVARAMNTEYERFDAFWSRDSYSAVTLVDAADVIDKLVYTITNPVAAGLVAKPQQWPGLITLPADIGSRTLKVSRPKKFFQKPADEMAQDDESERKRRRPSRDPLPDTVELAITKPPAFADVPDHQFQRMLADAVQERLQKIYAERRAQGKRGWLGATAVKKQHHLDSPDTTPTKSSINPRIACKDKWRRIEVLGILKSFREEYRRALAEFRKRGKDSTVLFPHGTYWMRVHFGARCHAAAA